jgi:hypothetical protein
MDMVPYVCREIRRPGRNIIAFGRVKKRKTVEPVISQEVIQPAKYLRDRREPVKRRRGISSSTTAATINR